MASRTETIDAMLRTAFKGHFDVTIVSEHFDGLNRIARHRLVYDALGAFMESDIHALRITALSPAERQARG